MYAEFEDAGVKKPVAAMFVLAELVSVGYGQKQNAAGAPFTLTWSDGKCLGCKNAAWLGKIQFVSPSEVWGVGFDDVLNAVNTVVVHSTDGGRTWREVPQSQQYTDPDGRLAFSFLDAARGWIVPLDSLAAEGKMIRTRDGGRHWQRVSQQFLQIMQFIDESHGFGTVADEFFRTNDGGRSWVETRIPDIGFITCMLFLTRDNGWIAGIHGKDFLVFRTFNGGRDWTPSRTTPPRPPEMVHDLFFFNQQSGWLITWNHSNEGGAFLYSTVDGGEHWTPDPDLSFQGKGTQGNVVRFTSRARGFVFFFGRQAREACVHDGWGNSLAQAGSSRLHPRLPGLRRRSHV